MNTLREQVRQGEGNGCGARLTPRTANHRESRTLPSGQQDAHKHSQGGVTPRNALSYTPSLLADTGVGGGPSDASDTAQTTRRHSRTGPQQAQQTSLSHTCGHAARRENGPEVRARVCTTTREAVNTQTQTPTTTIDSALACTRHAE